MGGYFEGRGLIWNLNAAATPKAADVAHHTAHATELARVQIEMGGRAKIGPALTRLLREHIFEKHPEVPLRVYFAKALDLSFLEDLPMVQDLNVEVGARIDSAGSLRVLRKLRTLALTLPNVVAPDILAGLSPTLESLSLGPDGAKHADIDLTPVTALPELRTLMLRDFGTDLSEGVLPRLTKLRRLVLRSIKNMKRLDPISGLTELRSLTLQRGAASGHLCLHWARTQSETKDA